MVDYAVRLSPSGKPLFTMGTGAQLRLKDTTSLMTGSAAIPPAPQVICPDGFGNTDAIVLTLPLPKADHLYGAEIELDVINTSTNAAAEVVLYLDVSVDGGATYTNVQKNNHHLSVPGKDSGNAAIGAYGRTVTCHLPQTLGSTLGVVGGATPSPSLKLRARASGPDATGSSLQVDSSATSGGGTPVTGLNGTIYMALGEYLA